MITRRVKLTFMEHLIRNPLIYEMTTCYEVVTSIYQAQITDGLGWVVLDLSGEAQVVDQAAKWLCDEGVTVEYVH